MLGAPGSGKGTWSKILSDHFALPHISTGDLFRRELAEDTELGREARSYMERGALVPDELTIRLLKKALCPESGDHGFVLDGYPRTIPQAKALTKLLAELGVELDAVIDIVVDEDLLVQRTLSRLICSDCGQPYNTTSMRPKKDCICDRCGGRVTRRSDDTEETLRLRLEEYHLQTKPLIEYYCGRGKLITYNNDSFPDETAKQAMLLKLRNEGVDG